MKVFTRRLISVLLVLLLITAYVPVKQVSAASAGSRLQGMNKTIYDYLKTQIKAVANGTLTSTEFTISDDNAILSWTKEDLGVSTIISGNSATAEANQAANEKFAQTIDVNKIIKCLLVDCPYEMYWYNKTKGASIVSSRSYTSSEVKITSIVFKFAVSSDYASGDYAVDASKIAATASAVDTAKAIVAKYAGKSDVEKLTAYRDEICQLAEYNHTAADNPSTPYGAPWQMVSVFDNDPATKSVCEGYAKAFKYLCDLTDFDGDVSCHIVDGYMQGGTGEGNHMWNVVQIDGGVLLVDVTNCDEGSVGAPDKLFLKSGQKNGSWYAMDCGSTTIYYTYSETEKDLHTNGYLELKAGNRPLEPTTKPTEPATAAPTVPAPTNPPATTPVATQPGTTVPAAPTNPPATTPIATTPAASTPIIITPVTTMPSATTPLVTTPLATTPTGAAPTAPMATVPVAVPTTPATTEPTMGDPVATGPALTDPTEPISIATEPTAPIASDPEAIQPQPGTAVATESDGTEPTGKTSKNYDDEDAPNDNTVLFIIIAVVCAAAIAVAVVLIIKKKKDVI